MHRRKVERQGQQGLSSVLCKLTPLPREARMVQVRKIDPSGSCTTHKEPEMKKFVATASTVVAPSVDKSSKVSDSKKRNAKEDVGLESDILVKSPPAKSHQQKSIADVRKEDPKIKLKCNVGGKSLPTTKICVSCKILPPSNLSIFYFTYTEHSIFCIM
jgi:hypothetical protein